MPYHYITAGSSPRCIHSAENWNLYRGTKPGFNGSTAFSPQDFSWEIIAYWLSFVCSGDPDTYKLDRSPQWIQGIPQIEAVVTWKWSQWRRDCAFIVGKVNHQQN
ncbi:hypothetical protein NEOLEDRAFT_1171468 [Neolentinus lepideus HHB14362 ss-1]|uniref:Uncharacterized protein n=1 Tax=Neolentinus lepideus HHB14362 ss-1 TaxID=1314782 RepID=A0A165QEK5_9AGAM|nr:hypothetical protein NEOLEDRAFT_1171468 [Neolentinus lepideus HHB14362 ss-1]